MSALGGIGASWSLGDQGNKGRPSVDLGELGMLEVLRVPILFIWIPQALGTTGESSSGTRGVR